METTNSLVFKDEMPFTGAECQPAKPSSNSFYQIHKRIFGNGLSASRHEGQVFSKLASGSCDFTFHYCHGIQPKSNFQKRLGWWWRTRGLGGRRRGRGVKEY